MAGDWLKIRNDLDDDPHVLRMAEILGGMDVDLVIGKLRKLWRHGDRHTTDGFIPFASGKTIDTIVNLDGFSSAAEAVGWLELTDKGVRIPRFEEHNGDSAKARAKAAARQQKSRANRRKGGHVTKKCDTNVTGALPREEKRRVEKKKKGEVSPLTPLSASPENLATASDNRPSEEPCDNPAEAKKTRKHDLLFDAVVEVTASDPKVSGSHVGRICKALREADPPYTPEEVRRWAQLIRSDWPQLKGHPTLGMIEKYIGRVRGAPASPPPKPDTERAAAEKTRQMRERAQRERDEAIASGGGLETLVNLFHAKNAPPPTPDPEPSPPDASPDEEDTVDEIPF